ncbi:response regulator transcription factor, partial [bacterium]|nr:response regulator transcription factor [bacterium]
RLRSYHDAQDAWLGIRATEPDVALVNKHLGKEDGLRCVTSLKLLLRPLPVVVVSAETDGDGPLHSLFAGACGYLTLPVEPVALVKTVLRAAQGRFAFCQAAEARLVAWAGAVSASIESFGLTPRERELLPYFLEGLGNKETAGRLKAGHGAIDPETVRQHRAHVYRRTGAHNVQQLRERLLAKAPSTATFRR